MSQPDTSTGSTLESTAHHCFERLCAQSPSAKLVYRVLEESETPLTTQTLSERTLLAPRTTRYALRRLRETDLVTRTVCSDDPRQYRYQATAVNRPNKR
jgi:transcription initiation factor IIE alpha subunit